MFGESDAGESPRVASPWEALISNTPPSSAERSSVSLPRRNGNIPKLVPEAEEGNVEYKLQLLSPSPARFARLVTQLKWRLLEGGGQAYYELGVADSGALVGLTRADLERTLDTLGEMAGEIGASVIVVREVEVPVGMRMTGMGGLGGKWNKELGVGELDGDESSPNDTTTDEDCSPSPSPDASQTLFAMDPEPEIDPALASPLADPQTVTRHYSLDLEISTVYKPRPTRRTSHSMAFSTSTSTSLPKTKKYPYPNPPSSGLPKQKHKYLHQPRIPNPQISVSAPQSQTQTQTYPSKLTDGRGGTDKAKVSAQEKQQAKALSRRVARDRRREEKKKALGVDGLGLDDQQEKDLVQGLQELHVNVDSASGPAASVKVASANGTSLPAINGLLAGSQPVSLDVRPNEVDTGAEPRLIVEALVVRKLSLEEAFLDFGGFSMI